MRFGKDYLFSQWMPEMSVWEMLQLLALKGKVYNFCAFKLLLTQNIPFNIMNVLGQCVCLYVVDSLLSVELFLWHPAVIWRMAENFISCQYSVCWWFLTVSWGAQRWAYSLSQQESVSYWQAGLRLKIVTSFFFWVFVFMVLLDSVHNCCFFFFFSLSGQVWQVCVCACVWTYCMCCVF